MIYCKMCKDEFDPVESADVELPLCSSECEDAFWEAVANEVAYVEARYGGAPPV